MFAETKNAAFWPDISEQPQQFCRGNFQFIGRGRAVLLGGGDRFKTGWPVTMVGHIQACPTRFLARQRRLFDRNSIIA